MSNQEFNPNENPGATEEQIPHSGVHGFEQPVTDFDKTSLRDAHEQNLIKTPETPAALYPTQEKQKMSRGKKIGMWLAGGLLAGSAVPVSLAIALNGDNEAPNQEPGVSGPEVPGNGDGVESPAGIFVDAGEAGFDGEVPAGFETPITLTDAEVATLQSEDYAASRVIYDAKLVPVMNAAVTALLANGGTAEGLNFSNVINDKNTISQLEELVSPYAQYGDNMTDQILQLCETRPNEDGRNFCGPLQASRVNLNENIIWDLHHENSDNPAGEEVSLHTAMQPRIYEGSSYNKLIVATDGAIRSDF